MAEPRYIPPQVEVAPKPQSKTGAIVSLLLGLLYGISPIDLIPDLIPLLGWSDDVVVIITAIVIALRFMRAKKAGPIPPQR